LECGAKHRFGFEKEFNMPRWHHSPLHKIDEKGAYIITAGTYKKQHFFNTTEKMQLLENTLFTIANEVSWNLQAWALFSNHYHFVAISPDNPQSLKNFILKLHLISAREINKIDGISDRRIWFQYWETHITFYKSYFVRLNYVHNNPVHHRIVRVATEYPWCSARWFENKAKDSFKRTISSFKTDKIKIIDDF
jgi:putative transposase